MVTGRLTAWIRVPIAAATVATAGCAESATSDHAVATSRFDAVEQARPECTEQWLLHRAGYAVNGGPPDRDDEPTQRFLYEVADSVWCRSATLDDLVRTGRAIISDYPDLCRHQPIVPEPEVVAFVDNGTAGGPVMAAYHGMELGMGRTSVYVRFIAAAVDMSCVR